jgi:hypothetical protein
MLQTALDKARLPVSIETTLGSFGYGERTKGAFCGGERGDPAAFDRCRADRTRGAIRFLSPYGALADVIGILGGTCSCPD